MEWLVHCLVLVIWLPSKHTEGLLSRYYDVGQVLVSIQNQFGKEIGHFMFVRSSFRKWSGALHSSSCWISLKTHQMTPLTILCCCQSFRLDPKLIGQRNGTLQVRTANGAVGTLHCSRDWISLQTHQMTPPTILWCYPCFGVDPKSIGQRNGTLQVRTVHKLIRGLHSSSDWISLKTHQMTPLTILGCLPSLWLNLKSIDRRNWTLQVRTVNGVVGALHSSSHWISLKTHRMNSPTILWYCPSFGVNPKSIGQRN